MNVLVLNCGSSTVKFQLIATDLDAIAPQRRPAAGARPHRAHRRPGHHHAAGRRRRPRRSTAPVRDMRAAVDHIIRWASSEDSRHRGVRSVADIHAVGHRVVHGGERFTHSVLIDDEVLRGIEDCIELAPLHNPANIKGIHGRARRASGRACRRSPSSTRRSTRRCPSTPTSTRSLPVLPPPQACAATASTARRTATSPTATGSCAASRAKRRTSSRCTSATAARRRRSSGGDSVDTSMGFTPLEGLVMGTRSGDLDPAILDYLAAKEGLIARSELERMLNKQSGLLGISGLTNDMRELLDEAREHDDRRARLAIEIFCYRVRKYIGAYLAAMGGADAIVFTGGIGENAPEVRARICDGLRVARPRARRGRNASCRRRLRRVNQRRRLAARRLHRSRPTKNC